MHILFSLFQIQQNYIKTFINLKKKKKIKMIDKRNDETLYQHSSLKSCFILKCNQK